MAKPRKKSKNRDRRAPVIREDRSGPTPQTLAKLQHCPIRLLFNRKAIDAAERDAALEIAETISAITRCVGCSANDLLRVGGASLPPWAATWHRERYVPWVADIPLPLGFILDLLLEGDLSRVDSVLFCNAFKRAMHSYSVIKHRTIELDRLRPRE